MNWRWWLLAAVALGYLWLRVLMRARKERKSMRNFGA